MKPVQLMLSGIMLCVAGVASATTIEMTVNGLVCAFCAQGIEKKLRKFPATEEVLVSLERHQVALSLKEGQDIADEALKKALTDAGYTVKAIARTEEPFASVRDRITRRTP